MNTAYKQRLEAMAPKLLDLLADSIYYVSQAGNADPEARELEAKIFTAIAEADGVFEQGPPDVPLTQETSASYVFWGIEKDRK